MVAESDLEPCIRVNGLIAHNIMYLCPAGTAYQGPTDIVVISQYQCLYVDVKMMNIGNMFDLST